uniref:hypothetical protein n=1 Tax=Alcanivorax jadensis TaxID=64988 RepID=UPI0026ED7B29
PGLALLVFIFGFGKSQLAHGIPGKWLIESPDYGKVGEFFRGSLVRDCENKGSFNYKHPQREPLGHFTQDILPWIKWGNCREDTTTREQRISAYVMDVELGLERLRANQPGYYLPSDFSFQKSGQSETIAFFLAALESSNFDLYNFIMNEQSSQEKRKAFYKALDQGINNLFAGKIWQGNGSEF